MTGEMWGNVNPLFSDKRALRVFSVLDVGIFVALYK